MIAYIFQVFSVVEIWKYVLRLLFIFFNVLIKKLWQRFNLGLFKPI